MMKKIGAAIIGCGAIHGIHADAIAKNTDIRMMAAVDIVEEKAAKTASRFGCDHYTDYRDMLKDKRIDVVHICTPHYLHASMAVDAMRSGKHVLVEKPVAISSSDAAMMARVSEETGKKLGVCFQNRYNRTSQKIKQVLDSGKAGRIIGAKAIVTWHRDKDYYRNDDWHGTWEYEGGGVLINQAIHTLDLLQWFLGDFDSLRGNADTRFLSDVIEVEDTADVAIIFKNGARAIFYATNNYVADSPVEIEIICEKAVIKLSDGLTIKHGSGFCEHFSETEIDTGGKAYWGCRHTSLINDFYGKLDIGGSFWIDAYEGMKTIRIIEAIYESTRIKDFVENDFSAVVNKS